MRFNVSIDPELNPDAVGEYLRSEFFDEKSRPYGEWPTYKETGCYDTFDWQKDVTPMDSTPVDTSNSLGDDDLNWVRSSKILSSKIISNDDVPVIIECWYYWDGDGTLGFLLPNGQFLVNNDCKKDRGWVLAESVDKH